MVITLLLSIMLTGCENRPNTNIDEAKKVASQYMKNKYNVSFNIESCKETKGYFTSESVMVDVRMKSAFQLILLVHLHRQVAFALLH